MNPQTRLLLVLIAIAVAVASIWYFSKPTHWDGIHAGMTREHIHTIVGGPTHDSHDLKGLETWRSSRGIFTWRLKVTYNEGVAQRAEISIDLGP